MSVTCLIPAYNESPRIGYVLEQLLQVKNILQIIVVDDGSLDVTSKIIKKYPRVILLHHSKNRGKSESLRTGIKQVQTSNILLFDADMQHFSPQEVDQAIVKFENNPQYKMLLFRTISDRWPQRFVRSDLTLTGCRILQTKDLEKILSLPITKFQLEPAINNYILRNQMKIAWTPFSGLGPRKYEKYGIIGIILDWKMFFDFLSYRGIISYILDTTNFPVKRI